MNKKLIQAVLVSWAFVTGVANYALIKPEPATNVAQGLSLRSPAGEPAPPQVVEIAPETPQLPDVDNTRVDYWVKRLTTTERRTFETFLGRAQKYAPMITAKLAEHGMPEELLYLAMIESGFNPNAKSPAGAK